MSPLKQLFSNLNHYPEYTNHVALHLELPDILSSPLAQIQRHPKRKAIKEQAQMMISLRLNSCNTGTELATATEPPNAIDCTGQYRCSQASCLTQAPYKTLIRFRNHMVLAHGLKKEEANAFISEMTRALDGVARVNDPVRFANTPISTGTLPPAANFSRATHELNQEVTASPMLLSMSHPSYHHSDAEDVLMHDSVPPQSNVGLNHPHYHTNTTMNDTAQCYTRSQVTINANQPKYEYHDDQPNASTDRSGPAYNQPPNNRTTRWKQ